MTARGRLAWDDAVLVVLLLLIGIPRAILAVLSERPIGAEGAMSMLSVMLALAVVLHRVIRRRSVPS